MTAFASGAAAQLSLAAAPRTRTGTAAEGTLPTILSYLRSRRKSCSVT
jgi:hypothetical protein